MSQSNSACKNENFTDRDYLEFERNADVKHEFLNGKITDMAGASDTHNVIVSNLFLDIGIQARTNGCRTFSGDMRVKAYTKNYFYPVLIITYGKRIFEDDENDVLMNPLVIFEVLSKSTHLKDNNKKFDSYLKLESLTDYILVEQNEMRIEHYSKKADNEWRFKILSNGADELILDSVNCKITLTEIYNEVELEILK